MRLSFALMLVLPSLTHAQPTAEQKKETIAWVTALQAPGGGFYLAPQDPNVDAAPRPSLRATNGAVRALKYLGAAIPNKEKHAAFVLSCFDPKTGGFAEPGGKPDVTVTSVGVMVAMELSVPKEKFAKAMDYLKENAKTFEEVRIGAAAVEAWGVKDCPFKLDEWKEIAKGQGMKKGSIEALRDGEARALGSAVAFNLRLGLTKREESGAGHFLALGQREDGGWGKTGEKASDIETTYRVMRALTLVPKRSGEKWFDAGAVRKFVDAHRNKDGGYATKPGEKSSMSGVYYCTIITKWLDEMEAKK
ncbi:MAG: terpene cyclase/mutase family protein [Planctomycetes bacterium]|nr:terpene cyclase/mutase family protein [Planctomycetota bacterium]